MVVIMDTEEWGSREEIERYVRIQVSVAAHMYEKHDCSFLTDAEFDEISQMIDTSISTGNKKLDKFFREHFHPDTGMWIHNHPDRKGLERLYQQFYKRQAL